jgi:hypothetical protein
MPTGQAGVMEYVQFSGTKKETTLTNERKQVNYTLFVKNCQFAGPPCAADAAAQDQQHIAFRNSRERSNASLL